MNTNVIDDTQGLSVSHTAPAKVVATIFALIAAAWFVAGAAQTGSGTPPPTAIAAFALAVAFTIAAVLVTYMLRIAGQYETAVVLRLGKLRSTHEGEIFWLIPFVDNVIDYVDNRTRSSRFNAERVLTKDTVPVDADAIIFWVVTDAERATLEVANYRPMILQAAQASLRDIIGRSTLTTVLSEPDTLSGILKEKIGEIIHEWGIDLKSVELRDVQIPAELQAAMSREAQAEREKSARVILSQAELEIAENITVAAQRYEQTKGGLELRAMNLLYESMKTGSNTIIIPTSAANAMGLEQTAGLVRAIATAATSERAGESL